MGERAQRRHREVGAGGVIGNYLIERLVARGGFADVFLGRHVVIDRLAAIKLLRSCDSPELLFRFQREAQIVNRVGHPNIVDIFEAGELADGRPFLVMEWIDGESLAQYLRRHGAMSPTEALIVMEDLCDALAAAHRAGVVHRDIKDTNVMIVSKSGWLELKLCDFGVAAFAGDAEAARQGTPWSMSPEQFAARPVDARADIYAVGLLLLQMVSGRAPFHGLSAHEVEALHLREAAVPLDGVPVALRPTLRRCLSPRPEARFPSTRELLRSLRRALESPGPSAAHRAESTPV